ncbi:hypothetical protein AKO1_014352 [Acrasis kona]|uniref:Major facilitator superfamily (MFS) profile domain-containing protein n=1 Tax=Acrasis kona TaxID=1008807 RepID=A0AAW2Z1H2_9EUKA
MDHNLRLIDMGVFVMLCSSSIGSITTSQALLVNSIYDNDVSRSSTAFGNLMTVVLMLQLLLSPTYGLLTDIIGRRPIMITQMFFITSSSICLIACCNNRSIYWMVAAQVVLGLCGNLFQTCATQVADSSPHDKRGSNFALSVGVPFGIGFSLGSYLSSILNFDSTFTYALVANVLALLFCAIRIPETKLKIIAEKTPSITLSSLNPIRCVLKLFSNQSLKSWSIVVFVGGLSYQGFLNLFPMYSTHVYGFDEKKNGLYMSVMGLTNVLVQGLVLPRVLQKYGDVFCASVCLSIYALFCIMMASFKTDYLVFASLLFYSLGVMVDPILNGIMSKQVNEDQGTLQGGLSTIALTSRMLSSLLFLNLYSYTTSENTTVPMPSLVYYVAALLSLIAAKSVTNIDETSK